jgi:hypothetical protein
VVQPSVGETKSIEEAVALLPAMGTVWRVQVVPPFAVRWMCGLNELS